MRAGEFKAKCLRLMDRVQQTGNEIVITKHGKPVAKLSPLKSKGLRKSYFGFLKGKLVIKGDIVGPSGEVWDADR